MFYLNLGCGSSHLDSQKYINLDTAASGADIVARVSSLPFQSNSLKGCISIHTIEHLCYFEALHFLSECYRVLINQGKLIIETPDIEASFKRFLSTKSPRKRAMLLSWIFGISKTGWSHPLLYPKQLLRKMLIQSGFRRIKFLQPQTHLYGKGIRVECVKKASWLHDVNCQLRSATIKNSIINPEENQIGLDFERLFIQPMLSYLTNGKTKNQQSLKNLVCLCPSAFLSLCGILEKVKIPPNRTKAVRRIKNYAPVAEYFDRNNIVALLYSEYFKAIKRQKNPDKTYLKILKKTFSLYSKKTIETHPEPESLTELSRPPPKAFLPEPIREQIERINDRAARYISNRRVEEGRKLLGIVCRSEYATVYSLLNLAVASVIMGRKKEALDYYARSTNYRIDSELTDIINIEMIKLLIHLGKITDAYTRTDKITNKNLRKIWKGIVLLYKGKRGRALKLINTATKAGGKNCPVRSCHLILNTLRGSEKPSPPELRKKIFVHGEGSLHKIGSMEINEDEPT